mmetsp:Transcript_12477/g.18311  ORF Transcript_12477/g.18311 Transcript_12477/m.18311 type:complete len:233 (-) Transcript_12477:78-776(-)
MTKQLVIWLPLFLFCIVSTVDALSHQLKRRSFFGVTLGSVAVAQTPAMAEGNEKIIGGVTVYKTATGLQYIELEEGTGPSPRYGQLCSISYTAYLQLPNEKKKEKFDSAVFLTKHGNGRLIAGLDEGLHTMKVGGKRRIIIPPKLGFDDIALGPMPESPLDRYKLNGLLDKMVEKRGGNLIYDVELRLVRDDEADQGYYDDQSLTEEQQKTLMENINGGGRADSLSMEGVEA